MLQRTITGVIALACLAVVMAVRGFLADIVVIGAAIWGMCEQYEALRLGGHRPVKWPAIAMALLIMPLFLLKGERGLVVLLLWAIMATMFSICLREKPEWMDGALSLFPIVTVLLPLSMAFVLFQTAPKGLMLLGLVFVVALAGDTFAYFVGSLWGKHKLCPAISPKKTWEGSIGGLVASVGFSLIYGVVLARFDYDLGPWYHTVAMAVFGGVAGQLGDLSASLVKRHCGIKDFGTFFPGHGGIMDRIDSILFTLMAICSYALLVV